MVCLERRLIYTIYIFTFNNNNINIIYYFFISNYANSTFHRNGNVFLKCVNLISKSDLCFSKWDLSALGNTTQIHYDKIGAPKDSQSMNLIQISQ